MMAHDRSFLFSLNLMPSPFNWLLLAGLTVLCTSCDQNRVYEKNVTIKGYVWDSKFIPEYEIEIKDTSVQYNLYVNVRHAEIYPYRNIWLVIESQFPDGTKSSKRIEIILADEGGKWYGEGLGDIWDYRALIQENAFFNQAGKYVFTLQHNMRTDPLPGIMSIGFRVENTNIPASAGSKSPN